MLYTQTQQQNGLLEAVLTGSPAGIVLSRLICGPKGTHPAVNRALGGSDLLGKSVDDLTALAGLIAETGTILSQKFNHRRNFRQELKLGKNVYNLMRLRLHLCIGRDPQRHYITAELSCLKTQMIRMTSHDLPKNRCHGYWAMAACCWMTAKIKI
ncbi:MAG: hypothetical protein R3E39_19115 [Anaerolineae bacterium]